MRQWSLRITEYAERLLKGLEEIDFSDSMKEIQRNWIGKSTGAIIDFDLTPNPSPEERGATRSSSSPLERGSGGEVAQDFIFTTLAKTWHSLKENVLENRKNPTEAEEKMWQAVRNSKLGYKFRRQHAIDRFIVDFVCIEKKLVIEIDGPIHNFQKKEDAERTQIIQEAGFKVIRFSNQEVLNNLEDVLKKIKTELASRSSSPSLPERGTGGEVLTVFTTRPDTIFGVDFMVLAPEHDLVKRITTEAHKEEVDNYLKYVESRSEIDRMAEVKKITGCFTGAYAINPFNKRKIEVWISEYVLAGYGTGAIMAVPCGDERDHKFAKHFNIPITNIIGKHYDGVDANPTKDAVLENSDFLNGMVMHKAIDVVITKLEEKKIGKRQVNYKMRDAGWSRQRYWGEPFPVVYRNDMPYPMNDNELPLTLPDLNNFKSSGTGEGPLANLNEWIHFSENAKRDSNTMPTHAGAAWYFLRYMDPHNDKEFANKKALDYWNQVDVYIGGSEHAVAHLLYSRLWVKILHDLGFLNFDEPFKKLINQGMITGESKFVYRLIRSAHHGGSPSDKELTNTENFPSVFISKSIKEKFEKGTILPKEAQIITEIELQLNNKFKSSDNIGGISFDRTLFQPMRVDVNRVIGDILNIEEIRKWKPDFKDAEFILEDDDGIATSDLSKGKYICGSAVEKISKAYYNVVNPDEIVDKYGADTLRLYEMFLGPLEQSKPWSTSGIDGVYKFLRRFWNLFHDNQGNWNVSDTEPTKEEWKTLHKVIKKVDYDVEHFSFNTSVSEFMICTNELSSLKCNKRAILEPLTIVLASYAPHITEELWEKLGHKDSILNASYPAFNESYLKENDFEYPISINGKVRAKMNFALDMPLSDMEKIVMASEAVQKWTEGKAPKKVIIVPGRIVNIVL
jgi:leucyl-tRNA synthetase